MKRFFNKYIPSLLLCGGVLFTSCDKFLDIQPAGQLEQDKMFGDIQGFRDAMYGAYSSTAQTNLYGEALSYGFLDNLGQMFGYDNAANLSYYSTQYDYKRKEVKDVIDNIWASQYQTISYVNNIIAHINSTSIKSKELDYMKGECLGLRAFLHFDVARLFAEDYTRSTSSTRGIPYSTTFDLNNKELLTLHKTYEAILADLNEAETLLANDTVVNVETSPSSDYLKGRGVLFNKYAVAATKARVYYAMGNYTEAARYAQQVLDATSNFKLKKLSSLDDVKRYPANGEMIFGLYNDKLSSNISEMFLNATSRGNFTEARRDIEDLYDKSSLSATSTDLRLTTYYREATAVSSGKTFSFVRFIESTAAVTNSPLKGITLIRLPEMYYILAEANYDTNPTKAVQYLNDVRNSRGLEDVNANKTSSKEAFEKELMRERMREMPGEGQVFYSLKHFNRSFTDYRNMVTFQPSSTIFVLPWPEKELEFGNK